MPTNTKQLAAGRLFDTGRSGLGQPLVIYQVPESKSVIIKNVRLVGSHDKAFKVTVLVGTQEVHVFPEGTEIPAGFLIAEDREFILDSGDALEVRIDKVDSADTEATLARKLHYVLSGAERDQ